MTAETLARYCILAELAPFPGSMARPALRAAERIAHEVAAVRAPEDPAAVAALYSYPVPALSEDGTCSLHDCLVPEPYDLGSVVGPRSPGTTLRLARLGAALRMLNEKAGADWLGIYVRHGFPERAALVKLAYLGKPSRAEFPLTEEFARRSNNAAVGISGRAVVFGSVREHVAAGGAYYACDTAVESEACLPVFAEGSGTVIGVVDAEAFAAEAFRQDRLAVIAAFCALVAGSLLPVEDA